jgi:hypothetical protein
MATHHSCASSHGHFENQSIAKVFEREQTRKGVEATGKGVEATGNGIEATGKGVEATGKDQAA